jgi:hypothetical protein
MLFGTGFAPGKRPEFWHRKVKKLGLREKSVKIEVRGA